MGEYSYITATGQHIYQRDEIAAPRNVEPGPVFDRRVGQRDWRVGDAWSAVTVDLTGDDADQRPAVVGREQASVAAFDGLIPRRRELVLLRQIHPKLDPMKD